MRHEAHFETSSKNELYNTSDISMSVQVAFIVAGCTHTTYYKILKHALGINAVQRTTFQSTIKQMFPVVQDMVYRMCEEAKTEMKSMNQDELVSWNHAITSADGTWMTPGHELNVQYLQLLHWSSSLSKASLPERQR